MASLSFFLHFTSLQLRTFVTNIKSLNANPLWLKLLLISLNWWLHEGHKDSLDIRAHFVSVFFTFYFTRDEPKISCKVMALLLRHITSLISGLKNKKSFRNNLAHIFHSTDKIQRDKLACQDNRYRGNQGPLFLSMQFCLSPHHPYIKKGTLYLTLSSRISIIAKYTFSPGN